MLLFKKVHVITIIRVILQKTACPSLCFCYIHRSYITTEYQPAEIFCNFCLTIISCTSMRYEQSKSICLDISNYIWVNNFFVKITQNANRRFCVTLLYGLPGSVTLLVITSHIVKFSEKCVWYEPSVLVVSTTFLISFSHFRANPAILLHVYLGNNVKCIIFLATVTNHSFPLQI